jgi:hypothetical protein
MLQPIVVLLLAAHLLAMNVASAGPLIGLWLVWMVDDESGFRRGLAERVLRNSLAAFVGGAILGGALLLWPGPGLRSARARFPADAYVFAGAELAFSALCLGGLIFTTRRRGPRWLAAMLAIGGASNLLYHFPPLMAVLGELAADPTWAAEEQLDRRTLINLWRRPEIMSLWLHFILASFATAAIAALWLRPSRGADTNSQNTDALARKLGAAALVATLLQVPVGLWMLTASDAAARERMMGGSLVASAYFAGGVMTAVWLLQTLAMLALGEGERAVRRAGWLLVAVTILMTATLRTSRAGSERGVPDDKAAASPLRHSGESATAQP